MTDPLPLIYFVRHGETSWNKQRRIQGQTDIELNDTGQRQAKAIAASLARQIGDARGFQVYVSPLMRTRQTLEPIAGALKVAPQAICTDERLREISFGDKEGCTWPQLNAARIGPVIDPQGYFHWRPKDGESYSDLTARVRDWLAGVDGPAIVVSHGGVSRVLRGIVFGLPEREIVSLPVPQDKYYRIIEGRLEWISVDV